MKFELRTKIIIAIAALCVAIGLSQGQFTKAQDAAQQPQTKTMIGQRGGSGMMGGGGRGMVPILALKP
jgi:hypothetical protein